MKFEGKSVTFSIERAFGARKELVTVGTILLSAWVVLGLLCYVVLVVGAFQRQGRGMAGFGCLSLLFGPILVSIAPLIVAGVWLKRRSPPAQPVRK